MECSDSWNGDLANGGYKDIKQTLLFCQNHRQVASWVSSTKLPALRKLAVRSSVLDDSLDQLNDSMSVVIVDEKFLSPVKVRDVEAWITAALTDRDACLDTVGEFSRFRASGC
ncbi:hypothetical protein RYX36_023810 [Vicia faba]